jgi:hypothetical protein
MSTSDPLIADFERLLDKIPATFTLEQWQFAYKKMIFTMGLKILEKFPENALGPKPTKSPPKGRGPFTAGGPWGQGPIIHLASAALDLAPPPPP